MVDVQLGEIGRMRGTEPRGPGMALYGLGKDVSRGESLSFAPRDGARDITSETERRCVDQSDENPGWRIVTLVYPYGYIRTMLCFMSL